MNSEQLPLGHSPEVFAAYAEIDCGYYLLGELTKQFENRHTRTPLEAMIDKATGRDDDDTEKFAMAAIELIRGIIRNKKIIQADHTHDSEHLKLIIASLTPTNGN